MKPKTKLAQKPRDLKLKPSDYQPTRTELREEHDMPGMPDKKIRDSFFRPFNIVKKGKPG